MDLYLTSHDLSLHRSGESILVRHDGKTIFETEQKHVQTIQIFANVSVSAALIQTLLREGIELAYFNRQGELIGQLTPPHSRNIHLRYMQFRRSEEPEFRLNLAREMIRQKMAGCLYLLDRLARNHRRGTLTETEELLALREKAGQATAIEQLMGIEGTFARRYFGILGSFFKSEGLFAGRSKRPPRDPANAVLSFLYTLVTNRLLWRLDGAGLDPYLGFLHGIAYGRASLACDLVEGLRALFCDRLALRWFNRRMLTPADFEGIADGVYLKRDSLKRFLAFYDGALREDMDLGTGRMSLDDCMASLLDWLKQCIESGVVQEFS